MLTEHQQREFAEKAHALKLQKQKEEASTSRLLKHRTSNRFCSFQDNLGANEYRKDRRLHGFQLPFHPLQVAGWLAIVIFVCATFLLLIPVLPIHIQPVLNWSLTALFITHIITHIVAVLIDPADKELRRISTRQVVPEFDRAKHAHVIENGRCHLCNIKTTSNRTKHCSVCNKCVGRFDHHCKWLNHCIGGRNYVAFLMCVLSAVIAVLVILAACIAEITIYYFKPEWLNIWSGSNDKNNHTDTLNVEGDGSVDATTTTTIINEVIEQANVTLIANLTNVLIGANNGTTLLSSVNNDTIEGGDPENLGLSINGTIFVIFAATVGLLAAISAGLLLHLCFFHVYISYLGLTTYEYIRQQKTSNVTYPPALYQGNKNGTHKKENGSSVPGHGSMNGEGRNGRYSFFRSKSAEADFYFCSNVNPSEPIETTDIESQNRPKTLYCCDRVESHHHRHKAYYMCSVMEDPVVENSMRDLSRINYYPEDETRYESKTFHCCSEFVESGTTDNQADESVIGTVTGMLEQSRREAFLHYTEQCTFCSFRIKTPAKRQHISLEDKRCCIKTVSKHHRWRRKWNCCSNVPDSPDVPMGINTVPQQVLPSTAVLNVRSLNPPILQQQQQQSTSDQRNNNTAEINSNTSANNTSYEENSANNNNVSIINGNNNNTNNNNIQTDNFLMNRNNSPNNNTIANEADIQQMITISSSSSTTTIMPPSSSSSNTPTPSKRMRVRGIRPVFRLRHMFRVLGKRYRRPRCRHGGVPSVQVKQNQIRPLPGTTSDANYNGPPLHQQEESNNGQYSTITHQTILPTSAIRSETIVAATQYQQYTLPALPPPQRRKIRTTEDIQDLADTLTLVQQQQTTTTTTTTTPSTIIRLSTPNQSNGTHRRHSRRKQILRPRSPTLSPIHESGLSNPTSPLPCHRQNSGETPDDDDEDEDTITASINSLNNAHAHLCARLNLSPNVSPNKRQVKV